MAPAWPCIAHILAGKDRVTEVVNRWAGGGAFAKGGQAVSQLQQCRYRDALHRNTRSSVCVALVPGVPVLSWHGAGLQHRSTRQEWRMSSARGICIICTAAH